MDSIQQLLDKEAFRINNKEFIKSDPVQFPHRFSDIRDIEIVALLSAIMAWGKRTLICRDVEKTLEIMENEPYKFVIERAYEDIPPQINIHRTLFGIHLKYFLRGLQTIYSRHNCLDTFSKTLKIGNSEFPAWQLTNEMQKIMKDVNNGQNCPKLLPTNLDKTALKRINMALRWLVRNDGIVDLGVWTSIPKSKLFIPLDVHVGNTARRLQLITRKSNDRRTVIELTEKLRKFRPHDPTYYDFALFGLGIGE